MIHQPAINNTNQPSPKAHLFDMDADQLRQWMDARSMPSYRAAQILEWVYKRHVDDFSKMTNLSAADRAFLAANLDIRTGRTLRHQQATDGTQKLLLGWPDAAEPASADQNTPAQSASAAAPSRPLPIASQDDAQSDSQDATNATECVMIPAESTLGRARRTACISSQVGCPVGCRFCASGLGGLDRNLTTGQIVEQIFHLNRLPDLEGPITNIVFMGMGEPLANFSNVTRALKMLTAEWGFHISARKITLSTVGVPSQIRRLAEVDLPITLALSLHAPNDELRKKLIPWAQFTTIQDLMDACREYFSTTGREITLEYILLGGVNDTADCARELAALATTLRANVNLIRYNEVKGMRFNRPASQDVIRFQQILRQSGINAHIRASRGRDIAAACGQLRHEARA